MKVLKPGKEKVWTTKAKCTGAGNGGGGCGAELQIEKSDLFMTARGFYDGSDETYITFKCVTCGIQTDLDKKKVPDQIARGIGRSR